jgi:hypothetical protein
VTPGSPFNGQLTITFEANIDPISNFAQQLFIEGLQKTGLFVRDFENWQSYIGPNFVQLSGPLSLHSMRRFGSLIKAPVPNHQPADSNQTPLQATQNYWKNLMSLLEELRTEKASTDRAQAGWYNQFADQIDKMPTLNVDPDLVTFGLATADQLRGLGTTDRGIGLQRGLVQQQGQNNMGGPPANQGYWGYSGRPQPNQAMQGNQLQDQAKMAQVQLWQRVDDATGNIRARLSQKYMVQF